MLHIYRNIKNKKLQTNIIPAGQDVEHTNMITTKRVYGHMITKNRAYARSTFKLLLFYKIGFDYDLYTNMIRKKNTNMITKTNTNIKIKFKKKAKIYLPFKGRIKI